MLNITKIPTSSTSLNFQSTSQSQNNYGGYGSKQAQDQAYVAAVQQSQKDNPEQFIDKKTGKTYDYVNKTIQKAQAIKPTQITKISTAQQKITVKPININTQKMQQGPVQPISSIPTMGGGSIDISESKVQSQPQYYQSRDLSSPQQQNQQQQNSGQKQWSQRDALLSDKNNFGIINAKSGGDIISPGNNIVDAVYKDFQYMGLGTKNVLDDYTNIINGDYEDKSLSNQSTGQAFEGNFEGAGKTITSNIPKLIGEALPEVPLSAIPVAKALEIGKTAVNTFLKKAISNLVSNPTIIKSATPAEKIIIEKAADKVLLNNKQLTKAELDKLNTITTKINLEKRLAEAGGRIPGGAGGKAAKYTKKYTADEIKNAEKLISNTPGTKIDKMKATGFVKGLDGSIEKEIKNQLKPEYTKRYTPKIPSNKEALGSVDPFKVPLKKVDEFTKFYGGFTNSVLPPTSDALKNKETVRIMKSILADKTASKTQKLSAMKVLEKMAKDGKVSRGGVGNVGSFKGFGGGGATGKSSKFTKSYFGNAEEFKAFAPIGLISPAAVSAGNTALESSQKKNSIFNNLSLFPSVPEADAFPGVGPTVKGTVKVVKGGMTEFEKMYRQLPHDKQMDIFKNAFFSPNTQKIAEKINAKSTTGLRTNTVKNLALKTKGPSAAVVQARTQAIRTQWLKNVKAVGYAKASILTEKQFKGVSRTQINTAVKDLRPSSGKAGELQRRANNVFANDQSHTAKLSLGAIGAGIVGSFEGFGQLPQAYAMDGNNQNNNKNTSIVGGVPWVVNNLNSFTNPSIFNSNTISNSTKNTNSTKTTTIKNRDLLAEQNTKTKILDYNINTGAPKVDEARSSNSIIKGSQVKPNQTKPNQTPSGFSATVIKGAYTQPPILNNHGQRDFMAEQRAMAAAIRTGTAIQSENFNTTKSSLSKNNDYSRLSFNANPKLNSSYYKEKTSNVEYANGPKAGSFVSITTIKTNPYEELGNFSNPNFGLPSKKISTKQGTSNKDTTKPKPIINPYGNFANSNFGLY